MGAIDKVPDEILTLIAMHVPEDTSRHILKDSSLRLVSRAFDRTMTPVIWSDVSWYIPDRSHRNVERCVSMLQQTGFHAHVRILGLRTEIKPVETFSRFVTTCTQITSLRLEHPPMFPLLVNWSALSQLSSIELVRHSIGNLPVICSSITRLRKLKVTLPTSMGKVPFFNAHPPTDSVLTVDRLEIASRTPGPMCYMLRTCLIQPIELQIELQIPNVQTERQEVQNYWAEDSCRELSDMIACRPFNTRLVKFDVIATGPMRVVDKVEAVEQDFGSTFSDRRQPVLLRQYDL